MPRKCLTLALAGLTLIATVFAIPRMTEDQRALHALNRLTFGPRPGDLEQVKKMGVEQWIEQQLNPDSIPENPVLVEKLEPLDTLGLSAKAMLQKYPSQQMIKAMSEGRMALPEDKETRAAVQAEIERYRRRQAADDAQAAVPTTPQIGEVTIGDMQTKIQTPAPAPAVSNPPQIPRPPGQVVNRDLAEGKLLRAVYSNRQLEEVLTDFWFNHFNIYLDKGADRYLVTEYERDVIRPRVLGKFRDLLSATAKSPAMLFYLDNWQSVAPDTQMPRRGKNGRG